MQTWVRISKWIIIVLTYKWSFGLIIVYQISGKVHWAFGCESNCLLNSAESSIRGIHSCTAGSHHSLLNIFITNCLSGNSLNRDLLSQLVYFNVQLTQNWPKLRSTGQSNCILFQIWISYRGMFDAADSNDGLTEVAIFLLSVNKVLFA